MNAIATLKAHIAFADAAREFTRVDGEAGSMQSEERGEAFRALAAAAEVYLRAREQGAAAYQQALARTHVRKAERE